MKHQRTVKDDNMMREGLMQPRDEPRGRGQTRQRVLLDWAVREPRRSRRTRRELNYSVFASRGSEIGALASTSNLSLSRSK
nr:hypothetical protein [Tanacetum cinerariifolium]